MRGDPRGVLAGGCLLLGLVLPRAPLLAADPAAPQGPAPPPSSAQPAAPSEPPGTEFVLEERVRREDWQNLLDFSEARDDRVGQWRFRTRFSTRFRWASRHEAFVQINNETRDVTRPDRPTKLDEVIFEGLWLDTRWEGGWSLRAGRQNVMRGEGFILFDGGPLDGSRTAYFNAADLAWTRGKGRIELLLISDPHRDLYLPRINDKEKPLIEWDEEGAGIYCTGTGLRKTDVEAYWIWKSESQGWKDADDPKRVPDREFHTVGGRAVRPVKHGFTLAAEAAGQWGSRDPDDDVGAWGGYARVKKAFGGSLAPSASLAWIGLSGDDPDTGDVEGWDPVFSRWPKWSELYIYSLAREAGPSYWTNLSMWEAEARIRPAKPLEMRLTWYRMRAFHSFPGDPATFGGGKERGDMLQFRADFTPRPDFRGHVLLEHFDPGDFYAGDDSGWFVRFEAIYTFRRTRGGGT